MPEQSLSQLPDDARLWIFAAEHPLQADQEARIASELGAFLARWNAHGHPVVGGGEVRHGRFILVAADERATGVSGCSIDSLFRTLGEVERTTGVRLLDSSLVFYRDAPGEIRSAGRADFRAMVRAGEVDGGTTVFDNTADSVGKLRSGGWERPLAESWHARAFGLEGASPTGR